MDRSFQFMLHLVSGINYQLFFCKAFNCRILYRRYAANIYTDYY